MLRLFKKIGFKLLSFLLAVFVVAFTGCKNADNNNSLLLGELNKSLAESNAIILANTNLVIESLASKTVDPPWSELAIFWKERADSVRSKCDSLISIIEELNATNGSLNTRVRKSEVAQLYGVLKNEREKLLNIHPNIDHEFRGKPFILYSAGLEHLKNGDEFHEALFDGVDSLELENLVLKFKNDVRTTENKLVNFCYNQVGGCILTYSRFYAIVNQNSTHFKPGEELHIQAGMGEFTNHSAPRFIINKQVIDAENGAARYKLAVSSKPGRYSIPVQITYYKPDGIRQVFQDSVRYTVDE